MVPAFNWETETPVANTTERIVFELLEDEVEESVPAAAASISKEELMGMSEFIKNLDVTFEIVSPINDLDFIVSSTTVQDIKVVEPKVFERQEQATFSFDLPLFNTTATPEPVAEVTENKILFELTNETRDINVNEAVQFVPMTELNDKGIIIHTLEEFTEAENIFSNTTPTITALEEVVPEEMNITMKQVDFSSDSTSSFDEISPMEMTIEDTLKFRADERRKKLKEFNYKFHNNISRIDELEKEPAYKRLGVDLSSSHSNNFHSRISLGVDSNDDLQLRSNNSYLHDNVD
jgi:cell division protein FtsZ